MVNDKLVQPELFKQENAQMHSALQTEKDLFQPESRPNLPEN